MSFTPFRTWAKRYLAIGALSIFVIVVPFLAADNYQIKIFTFVGIYSIVVLGLSLLMGYAGQISLGHAAFYGIGAYTTAILTTQYALPIWVSIPAAIVVSGFIALVVGIPTLRLKGHYLAMATLGFGEIMFILFVELDGLTGGPSGITGIPPLSLFGKSITTTQEYCYIVWFVAIVLLIFSLNIIDSRIGRALRAIHCSEVAAQATGINTSKYKLQVFVLSGIFGGIAGCFYAHFVNFISPSTFTLKFSILLVTMVVIGGTTNIWGALLGVFVLATLPEYLRVIKDYDLIVYASILILMMIFMPQGLLPGITEKFKNRKRFFLKRGGGLGAS